MLGVITMFLQAAALPAPSPQMVPADPRQAQCPSDADGDVVVCGKPGGDEAWRLRPLPEKYVKDRQLRLTLPGGGTVTPHADQGPLGNLQAKITLKVPF